MPTVKCTNLAPAETEKPTKTEVTKRVAQATSKFLSKKASKKKTGRK